MHRGETRSLLFVHGAAHRAQCWDEHFLPFFTMRGYRCVVVSLDDADAEPEVRATELVDRRLARIRQTAESVGDPVLVGHGAGGLLVREYLQQYRSAAGAVLLGYMPSLGGLQSMMHATGLRSMVFAGCAPHSLVARCYAEHDDSDLRAFCPEPAASSAEHSVGTAPVLVIEAGRDTTDDELLHSPDSLPVLERMHHWLRATYRGTIPRRSTGRPAWEVTAVVPQGLSRAEHSQTPGARR